MISKWLAPTGLLLVAVVMMLVWVFPHSLNKGQRVKQFFSHSLSQSLVTQGLSSIASTTLPCVDPATGAATQAWVEEAPLFHVYAASVYQLGLKHSALPNFLIGFVMLFALGLLMPSLLPGRKPDDYALLALVAFLVPATTRYWAQHLPDFFSTTALVVFVVALFRRHKTGMLLALLAAVTAKALAIVAAVFILLGYHWEDLRRWGLRALLRREILFSLAAGVLAIVPTLLWFWYIRRFSGKMSPWLNHDAFFT